MSTSRSRSPHNASVPPSPQSNRSDFEALIDLLGTEIPKPPAVDEGVNYGLRDEDGCLDFAKIRTMFSASSNSQNEHHLNHNENNAPSLAPPDTHVDAHGASQIPSQSIGPIRDSEISTLRLSPRVSESAPLSMLTSPAMAESTPIRNHPLLQPDLIDLSSNKLNMESNASPEAIEDQHPAPVLTSLALSQPNLQESMPSYHSIRLALDLTNKEVEDLRVRCRELENSIHGSRDPPSSSAHGKGLNDEPLRHPTSSQQQAGCQNLHADEVPKNASLKNTNVETCIREVNGNDEAVNVDSLTLQQARQTLGYLLDELGLSLPSVRTMLSNGNHHNNPGSGISPVAMTLEKIRHAIHFVTFVDELVWRRSRLGSDYDDPHDEENMEALKDRLALWEKTVRTRV